MDRVLAMEAKNIKKKVLLKQKCWPERRYKDERIAGRPYIWNGSASLFSLLNS